MCQLPVQRRLAAASRQNLRLLYNALPRQVAKELQEKPGNPVARELPEVAILFADIVGFSRLARRLSPAGLVEFLNLLFSSFDRCSAHFGVEKIKTIGDAYLAVAGVSAPDDATENAAHLALCLREEAARLSARLGFRISLRSGLHTGPVVAGVLGTRRFAFDVWGESVNIASRLQAAAPVDGILVSADARTRCSPSLRFGPAEEFDLRGCGRVSASVLKGRSTIAQLAGNRSGRIFR